MKNFKLRIHIFLWVVCITAFVLSSLISLTGCSTANNWKLPPYEVKRQELTCDRKTTGLPHGLICVCRQYGSTWDCQVARIE